MKLIHKLLLLFVVPLILVIISIICTNRWLGDSALRQQIEKTANIELNLHIDHINAIFQEKVNELRLIAASPVIQGGDILEILRYLENEQKVLSPQIEGLYYDDVEGMVYDVKGNTFSVRDRYYFPKIARGETVITKVITSRATARPIILILVPIFDNHGNRTGAIGATILITDLVQMIRDIKIGKTGFALLVDEDNRIVSSLLMSSSDNAGLSLQPLKVSESRSGLGLLIRNMHSSMHGTSQLMYENSSYLAYFKSIPMMRWSLALVYKESEILADVRWMGNLNIFIALFAVVSICLSIYGVRRILLNPIQTLVKVQRELGEGNSTVRADARSKDEIGELSRSFNDMADQLHERTEGQEKEISERRLAEKALQASEAKYRFLTEKMNDMIWMADLNFSATYISPSVEKILGFMPQEWMRLIPVETMTPESFSHSLALLGAELKREQEEGIDPERTAKVELEYYHKNGSTVWMELVVSAIRDNIGKIIGIHGVSREITERKRAELELKYSEKQYRSTIDAMADALHVVDKDLRILLMNKTFKQWNRRLGLEEETEGKSIFEVYPFLPAEIRKEYEMVFRTGKFLITEDDINVDGQHIFTETRKIPIFEREKVTRVITIIRDITERKRSEEEKKRLEDQLVQAQKIESIGTLAGGIAHDFNNILSAIIGYAELVINDTSDPVRVKKEIKEVLKAGDRAKNLVRQILTFSRKTDATYSPIILNTIITDSIKMMRSVLPSTIEIRQSLTNIGLVMADPTQIHQVMMNLCTNAAHAMDKSGGILEVRLEKVTIGRDANALKLNLPPGHYLRLLVSDTGHGMTPEVMARIFDPYFTTKEIGRGTGLGLAVVHGIVHGHGGAITCKSSPGMGTTFEIYLPEVLYEEEAGKHLEEKPLPRGTERILFVDDEPALVNLAERILSKLGYSVITKTNSIEALSLFKENPYSFDLVITDMTMPGMTGDRLAQYLMEIRKDIPVILCTGYSEYISEERAKKTGIREFFMKPFEIRVLAETIRKVLDGL
jgi:PAS domain S-box-containing protein